jgi:transposase, IS6 family
MGKKRPVLFRGRLFQDEIILVCVRWYLRYSLSYRDVEEMMIERGLWVDHSTIARWVLRYAPELNRRIRRELRYPNNSWRVDETYVRVAAGGPICIELSIRRAAQSSSCSRRIAI